MNVYKERLVVLVASLISYFYVSMCLFHYCESRFRPEEGLADIGLLESLYFTTMTVSTVGYGDITAITIPGRVVVILLILASLMVLPGLISNTIEAFALQRAGGGSYGGLQPFVVICGTFENPVRFMDVLNSLLNRELSNNKLNIVFLARNEPSQTINTILSEVQFKNRVTYLQGSALDATDMERVKLRLAEAAFILPDRNAADLKQEDEHNTIRAWAFNDFAVDIPLFVYNLLPETETFQHKTTRATVCIDSLKQILIGYNCLYEGAGTLMVNLLQQSSPQSRYHEPWQAEYGDGSGNEVYSIPVNQMFVRQRFADISWYLFREFQVILFAVNAYVPQRACSHLLLNPGAYELGPRDQLLLIAQDMVYVQKVRKLTLEEYNKSAHLESNASVDNISSSFEPIELSNSEFNMNDTKTFTDRSGFPPIGDGILQIGQPDPPYVDARVPLCRLLQYPAVNIRASQVTDASHMKGHLLIATGCYNVFRLLCTLRSVHVSEDDFKPILFMCEREPTEEEFCGMAPFPMVYWILGNPRKKRDLLRAGVEGAEKVVVLDIPSGRDGGVEQGDFADSGAIMVSHLIHDIFHEKGQRKYVVVELVRRSHIKFLRPGTKRRAVSETAEAAVDEFLYAPVYAAGRTYHNSSVLDMFKLMCGVRYQNNVELDRLLGINPAYLSSIDAPAAYEGKTFSSLYRDLALRHGIIPIGLLRNADDPAMGNKLSFVVTNPPPSLLVRRKDKVYVLRAVNTEEVVEETVKDRGKGVENID
ncbi:hypothetical protein HK097_003685 [Rhizophlyctis rosea]|uniref:Uncharacterized protein n=1 Tax=Rhizophlyctis rosea TaxID=64517 RepID=A0AAD5S2J1_9FUNG|nr:hypothetical protein HK097_003685 [Rhizophlyctis rosea]